MRDFAPQPDSAFPKGDAQPYAGTQQNHSQEPGSCFQKAAPFPGRVYLSGRYIGIRLFRKGPLRSLDAVTLLNGEVGRVKWKLQKGEIGHTTAFFMEEEGRIRRTET